MDDKVLAQLDSELEKVIDDLRGDLSKLMADAKPEVKAPEPVGRPDPRVSIPAQLPTNNSGNVDLTKKSLAGENKPVSGDKSFAGTAENPQPSNLPPWYRRGLRGLKNSIWYGQSYDNPDYVLYRNLLNKKEHVSLKEYSEATKKLDEAIWLALEDESNLWYTGPQYKSLSSKIPAQLKIMIDDVLDRYKIRIKSLFRRYLNSSSSVKATEPEPTTPTPTPPVAAETPPEKSEPAKNKKASKKKKAIRTGNVAGAVSSSAGSGASMDIGDLAARAANIFGPTKKESFELAKRRSTEMLLEALDGKDKIKVLKDLLRAGDASYLESIKLKNMTFAERKSYFQEKLRKN